jgi:hypothetical protein
MGSELPTISWPEGYLGLTAPVDQCKLSIRAVEIPPGGFETILLRMSLDEARKPELMLGTYTMALRFLIGGTAHDYFLNIRFIPVKTEDAAGKEAAVAKQGV